MFLSGKPAKKSPLVLLGAVSTAGVLVGGLLAFKKVCRHWGLALPLRRSPPLTWVAPLRHRQGNKDLSQSLMRARVLLQARAGSHLCSSSACLTHVGVQGATVAAMVITSGAFLVPTAKGAAPTR